MGGRGGRGGGAVAHEQVGNVERILYRGEVGGGHCAEYTGKKKDRYPPGTGKAT